jgi:nicotinate phosphoribosyltransferase
LPRDEISAWEPLLVEVLREGKLVCELPPLEHIRAVRQRDIERLDAGVRRLIRPHAYHVSLSQQLWDLKQRLIEEAHMGLC